MVIVTYMAKTRVLIIESDARIVQGVREHLLKFGFEVNSLSEFRDTRFLREVNAPHLVIVENIEQVKAIRAESQLPIIVTSTKGEVVDRVVGLEAGADDYLVKPYETRELAARIAVVMRRAPVREVGSLDGDQREWRFKGLTVQSNRRRILLDDQQVELTTAEFDLLRMLVANSQQSLSREQILDQLRGIEWEAVDRSVDILVSRLRDKLNDDPRKPRFIRTVRSVGYQFIGEPLPAESREEAASDAPAGSTDQQTQRTS